MPGLFHWARGALILALFLVVGAARSQDTVDRVGVRELELTDYGRHITLYVFYPAVAEGGARLPMPHYRNLDLLENAPPLVQEGGRPLVMFSHGKGLHTQ